ncbi:hypothetical protein [Paracoccus sp. (in: a-proteobacteria)]|uniref:hypothetical protein n=1 Tax=Paracoccus sp. TaxID=267 RepID=UPI00396C5333
MTRLTLPLLIGTVILSGCGRLGDSGLNPFGWWDGSSSAPASLEPEGGYLSAADERPGIPLILSVEWQPLAEGRLLVARGFAPVKGYHSAALVSQRSQPGDRLSPDADGVLRLRFVATPPVPDSPRVSLSADPATDTIVVALPFSFRQLGRISAVEVIGGGEVVTLAR